MMMDEQPDSADADSTDVERKAAKPGAPLSQRSAGSGETRIPAADGSGETRIDGDGSGETR